MKSVLTLTASPYCGSSKKQNNYNRLRKAFKTQQHCHWCGKLCKLGSDGHFKHGETMPDYLATYDHLFSRFDIRRPLNREGVIACHGCNHKRSNEEHRMIFGPYKGLYYQVDLIQMFNQGEDPERSVATEDQSGNSTPTP